MNSHAFLFNSYSSPWQWFMIPVLQMVEQWLRVVTELTPGNTAQLGLDPTIWFKRPCTCACRALDTPQVPSMCFLMLKETNPSSPGRSRHKRACSSHCAWSSLPAGTSVTTSIQAGSPLSFPGPSPATVPPKVVKIGITLPFPTEVGWSELVNKNVRCPVQFDFR